MTSHPHLKHPRARMHLVDPTLLNQWAEPEPHDDTPGACLPADFPREGLSTEQLLAAEDWWLAKTRTALLRLFSLLHTTREGSPPSAASVLYCVAALAKMLGYNEAMTWKELAESLGTNPQAFCLLRQALAKKMASFHSSPTPAEYRATASVLARQSRKHRLLAALLNN